MPCDAAEIEPAESPCADYNFGINRMIAGPRPRVVERRSRSFRFARRDRECGSIDYVNYHPQLTHRGPSCQCSHYINLQPSHASLTRLRTPILLSSHPVMSSTEEKSNPGLSTKRSSDSLKALDASAEKQPAEHQAVDTATPASKTDDEVAPVGFFELFR